MIVTEVTYPD